MILEAILAGGVITTLSFCIGHYVRLSDRITRIEIIQRFQLKKNGVNDEEIDEYLNNHGRK